MKAVILAASVGSRLGNPFPKSLSTLHCIKAAFETDLIEARRQSADTLSRISHMPVQKKAK